MLNTLTNMLPIGRLFLFIDLAATLSREPNRLKNAKLGSILANPVHAMDDPLACVMPNLYRVQGPYRISKDIES